MKYRIEENDAEAAYLQLYRQIREDIIRGIYPLHSKLPSKRVIALDAGVSVITAEHAYALLCEEGYAEARERSGYYVLFREEDGFASIPVHNPSRYEAGLPMGDADCAFPFSVLTKTMRRVIAERGEAILERSPGMGCHVLRDAIRTYLAQSRGILAERDQIVIGSGSEYLYTLLIELFGKQCRYAIEEPSYKKIEQVYTAAEVSLAHLPLGSDGIESEALQCCQADVLHISPYRSYPSGVSASSARRHEYLQWAEKEGRYIIEDDFESEFSIARRTEETLFSQSRRENVIYMNTFSKTISSSLRVGYMILPPQLAEQYRERLGFYSCTVPTYIQFVLAELIANGDFERHINRVRRRKRKQMKK